MNTISRSLRRALFLKNIVRARLSRDSCPIYVGIAATARCNLRCSFCFGRYYDQQVEDIALEDMFSLIDHLAESGVGYINFSGGEPLLRGDIGEILRYTLARNIMTAITTNGTLAGAHIDLLKELDFVCFSVDGDESSHDRVRGKGTHRVIMKNILTLRREGVPIQVTCILTRHNLQSLHWIFEAGRKYGFTVKLHIPNEETELGPNNPDISLTDEEIRKALGQVLSWQEEGWPIDFSSSTYRHALEWPKSHWEPIAYRGEGISEPWPCFAGRYWCQIDADGKVYPCCAMIKNFSGLDFREVGFDRAFAHTETRKCTSCAYLSNNEFNQLIALNPRPIWENAVRTVKGIFK